MSKLHRRAERASGRDWTQIVSRSGSSPRTRDHDGAEQRCSQNDRHQQTGRFSRRLQLGPGLEPPASWSLSPCCGPKFYLRADGRDTSRGPSFEFTAWSSSVANRTHVPHVQTGRVGPRPESVRRSGSPRGEPAYRGRVSDMDSRSTLDWWLNERREWWAVYAVPTAIRNGSRQMIFVQPGKRDR